MSTPKRTYIPNDQGMLSSLDTETLEKEQRIKILQRDRLQRRIAGLAAEQFDQMSLVELEVKLDFLDEKYNLFDNIQSEIEYIDESQFETPQREEVEDAYCSAKAKILSFMPPRHPTGIAMSSTHIQHNETFSKPKANLPKLQLPTFNGQQKEWLNFYNKFSVLVDKNSELSNIEKFQYLQLCLEGESAKLIQSLEVTDTNYSKAMELLTRRYDNKRYIFNAHLQEIFNIKQLSSPNVLQLRSFIDTINVNLRALQSFTSPNEISDGILLYLIVSKFDGNITSKWEEEVSNNARIHTSSSSLYLPTWQELAQFLERLCQTYDIISQGNITSNGNVGIRKQTAFVVSGTQVCHLCDKGEVHNSFKCIVFTNLDAIARYNLVKRKGLCLNCLTPGHVSNKCLSENRCQHCGVSHHTLLHREKPKPDELPVTSNTTNNEEAQEPIVRNAFNVTGGCNEIIIATALVELSTNSGRKMTVRALLDSASQLHFISERVAQFLRLSRQRIDIDISGIGSNTVKAYQHCCFNLNSLQYAHTSSMDAIILPSITTCQPHRYINISKWKIPANIKLADNKFNVPGPIDVLIGTGIFYKLLMVGQIELQGNLPILQKTSLGWIVAGALCNSASLSPSSPSVNSVLTTVYDELNEKLERFWSIEDNFVATSNTSTESEECELYFQNTTTRCLQTNRFVVRLSFKATYEGLGDSYEIAYRRFLLLEKRLQRDKNLLKEYSDFMQEYIDMGHMKLVPDNLVSRIRYYIPHHCVTKADSSTTRLRVVFDASCKSSNGVSLNQILRTGPVLQNDLFTILFRFRMHRYVLMADIAKMFRQILLHPDDRNFQCIFWRNSPEETIRIYQLQTVTYGTTCASFLATKCLQQLAIENTATFPIGSAVTLNDFYVDNLMTGADSIDRVLEIKTQVNKLLHSAGLPLRKFASNVSNIIEDIELEDREKIIRFHDAEFIKALGLKWSPSEDTFLFSYEKTFSSTTKFTKRRILSHIASFFDPLGLINPIIVSCKILMQTLWKMKLNWDESVPQSIATQWISICEQLPHLTKIRIERFVLINNETEIHAFADASTKAYGACIYAVHRGGDVVMSSLLCAKSRVAPTRTVTLPRLELSATLLLAELLSAVQKIINTNNKNIHCWTDSSIALAWIKGDASRWVPFVSNRVKEIQELTAEYEWHHCPTVDNPADLVSRGVNTADLIDNNFWFHGPNFLKGASTSWPNLFPSHPEDIPEQRKNVTSMFIQTESNFLSEFKYINNFGKTIRIFAYVKRFISIARKEVDIEKGAITISEQQNSLLLICGLIQRQTFSQEYKLLSNGKLINRSSKLAQLSPFIENSIIRVGGRLSNSSLPYNSIHPVVLPSHHKFVETIINHFHRIHMHAGAQTLSSLLRDQFWIINARNTIRHVLHKCIICYRCRPKLSEQIMGSLPKDRVVPSYPFSATGVDYCGPFSISHRMRGKQPTKIYIAMFVCFTTKAVHMELAMDLSTNSFLAALKRFISRRGKCNTIYSDNATNFVGANRELKNLIGHFMESTHITATDEFCKQQGITWKFIPPRSPHFGGLWESAVKQAKYFLRRAVGNYLFTYDELQTVCCQAEAIINSRPLTPMSSDPDDLRALTPSHFLIGRTAHTIPEPGVLEQKTSLLKRHQQVQWVQECFWDRWHKDYLMDLQRRMKWSIQEDNLQINDLVLVKEDNLPPLKWQIGRIIETIPGSDDHVRVVVIKTPNGTQKRAITKVCKLPIERDD